MNEIDPDRFDADEHDQDFEGVARELDNALREHRRLTAEQAVASVGETTLRELLGLKPAELPPAALIEVVDSILDDMPGTWIVEGPTPGERSPGADVVHVDIDATIAGRWITVRLSAEEAECRVVEPDALSVLNFACEFDEARQFIGGALFDLDEHSLADGSTVWGVLLPDSLPALSPGAVLGFRLVRDANDAPLQNGRGAPAQDGNGSNVADGNGSNVADADDAPARDAPVQNANDAPLQDADDAPARDAPAQDANDAPVQNANDVPVQDADDTNVADNKVEVRILDEGQLKSDLDAELAVLGERMTANTRSDSGTELEVVLIEVFDADRTIFTEPCPPLAEMLETAGFSRRDAWWGPADCSWMSPGEQLADNQRLDAADTYGLDRRGAEALARASIAWRSWALTNVYGTSSDPVTVDASVADDLAEDLVAQAFFDVHHRDMGAIDDPDDVHSLAPPDHVNEGFRRFRDEVARAAPGAIGLRLLDAAIAERSGDADATEFLLRSVLRDDPHQATALLRLMVAMVDRGRFTEAVHLMRRLMGHDEPNLVTLERYARATVTAGRNEPCPCGSGRKYKQCHDGKALLDEPEATQSMVFKVERWTEEAVLRDRFEMWPSDAMSQMALGTNESTRDVLIHEGGFLERYLAERGAFLPGHEAERLRTWLGLKRNLYEVVEVEPGLRLGVRNVASGDALDLWEHTGSLTAEVGQHMWMRVERHHGRSASIGAVFVVAPDQVDEVLGIIDDPWLDADSIVDWLRGFPGGTDDWA